MSRVLGYVRLSRLTDETTSPGRQRDAVQRWAAAEGHELVEIVSDLDVSGAKSPFKRPQLGPWLARPDDFDILAVMKLDRLSRSARDTYDLLEWAEERGKHFHAISDSIGTMSSNGRIFLQLTAIFAEVERKNIQERVSSARIGMRQQGRWPAGRPPYGFRLVPKDFEGSMGYTLEEDPESADQLRSIVDQVLRGKSFVQIAADLNERGVLTPRNQSRKPEKRKPSDWAPQTITKMLRSVALLGQQTHRPFLEDGKTRGEAEVIHEHGKPVQFGPPILAPDNPEGDPDKRMNDAWDLWKKLQSELDSREQPTNRRRDTASLLLGFAFCENCGSRLHLSWGGSGKYRRQVYRCVNYRDRKCPVGPMYADNLETFVTNELLAFAGPIPIPKFEIIPGEDHTAELEQAEQSLSRLMKDRGKGLYDDPALERVYEETVSEYRATISKYKSQPVKPAEVKTEMSGQTVRDVWINGGHSDKREILEHLPFYVTVGPAAHRGSKDWWGRCTFHTSEDLALIAIAKGNDAIDEGSADADDIVAMQWAKVVEWGMSGAMDYLDDDGSYILWEGADPSKLPEWEQLPGK